MIYPVLNCSQMPVVLVEKRVSKAGGAQRNRNNRWRAMNYAYVHPQYSQIFTQLVNGGAFPRSFCTAKQYLSRIRSELASERNCSQASYLSRCLKDRKRF